MEEILEELQRKIDFYDGIISKFTTKKTLCQQAIQLLNGQSIGNTAVDLLDFDKDGVVSIIDYQILMDTAFGRNHSNLYNSENHTYNGKSLSLNGDNVVDVNDAQRFINIFLGKVPGVSTPMDGSMQQYDDKAGFSAETFIRDYCSEHNGEYPTLSQLKQAYQQA